MRFDRVDWLFIFAITMLSLALAMVIAFAVFQVRVDAVCKAKGWPRAEVTWNFNGYCIARIDQTDVVVPWREAE
jgi:hypothetical protein